MDEPQITDETPISWEDQADNPSQEPINAEGGVIYADQVHATGAIKQINANQVTLEQAAVMNIQSGSIEATNAGIGIASTQTATLNQAGAYILLAQSVEGEDPSANLMIARSIRGNSIKTSVLLSNHVEGSVETKLDTQGALFFGLAAGAGLGLVLSIFGFLMGRKQ